MATTIRRKKRSRAGGITAVILTVLCMGLLGVGGWLIYSELSNGPAEDGLLQSFRVEGLDPAAQTGAPPGLLNRDPPPGSNEFGYRIETEPVFSESGKGSIGIANPETNKYLLVLELCKKGDPSLLYQSQYIAPNQYIENITLRSPLESGSHDGIAYLNLVDPKSMEVVDILECPLTITVK